MKIKVHILDLDSKEATLDSNADTFVRSSWISLWRAVSLTSNLSSNDATQSKHDVISTNLRIISCSYERLFFLANQFWDNVKSELTLYPNNARILPLIKSYQRSRVLQYRAYIRVHLLTCRAKRCWYLDSLTVHNYMTRRYNKLNISKSNSFFLSHFLFSPGLYQMVDGICNYKALSSKSNWMN